MEMAEDIVISGIAGRFPDSDSIDEFSKNLFAGVDMVTVDSRRWPPGMLGIPSRHAKIKDVSKFDAFYFGVHGKQAHAMDAQHRLLLEVCYEAIVDSGYSAQSLRGKRIGVFIGQSLSETVEHLTPDVDKVTGYGITGNSKAMTANRVSFTFDFKGPSFTLDTACSSSFFAFQQAMLALRTGECEAAIVGGVNITLSPVVSLEFFRLNMLNPDGKCKSFDATGDGYARAETVSALLLQRTSQARRIYATVVGCKTNSDGSKEQGITFPSGEMQQELLNETVKQAGIDPNDVVFVEAHGTGTKVGDPEELQALTEIYCKNRSTPLPIGSVKSNMGHSESAAGMCSLAKVIIALEKGLIPPNLHFTKPNPSIKGLLDGSLEVVVKPLPLKEGSLIALNGFGFGGANAHILLRGNAKKKTERKENLSIPRLVTCCGRTEEGTNFVFNNIENNNYPSEFFVLLEEISKAPPMGMPYRGYMLKKPNEKPINVIERTPLDKLPVWFLFSGLGSQWPSMAKDMMNIEMFAKSIQRSAEIVKPYDVDLIHILTKGTEKDISSTTNCFVAIVAVQIALCDILTDMKIVPDGIVGHSLGETCCAYADGCMTAEQTLMCAYWRGRCCQLVNLLPGAMAAVGMTWEEAKRQCPDDVYPACHNGEDSVTITGSVEPLRKFVEKLRSENIFAREVDSCNIAFHCKYIYPIAEKLRDSLGKVIPVPKARTSRWVSSSVPEEKWDQPLAKYSSPGYQVNNLMSPVLFHEALCHVPKNAIVIEIASHGLFQSIVKKTLGASSSYVSLMKRNNKENVTHFLASIGKLYNLGLYPSIQNLYDPITYPVPRGTPSISSLIQWDHSSSWGTPKLEDFPLTRSSSDMFFDIDCSGVGSAFHYVLGHKINGRVLYPATGYLLLVWKAIAKQRRCAYYEIPIVFENVTLHRATIVPKDGMIKFNTIIMSHTHEFEISEGGSIVSTGKAYIPDDTSLTLEIEIKKSPLRKENVSEFMVDGKSFYRELKLRGYEYGPTFQGVNEVESNGLVGKLRWDGNWVTFMDSMLQFSILGSKDKRLFLPTGFQKVKINPLEQPNPLEVSEIPIFNDPYINACAAGAIEIEGLKCSVAPLRESGSRAPVLEEYHFVSNTDADILSKADLTSIQEYTDACSILARNIINAIDNNNDKNGDISASLKAKDKEHLADKYLNNKKENYVLLNVLNEISNTSSALNLKYKIKNSISRIGSQLKNDVLSSTLLTEKALRPSLDLVTENLDDINKLNILEMASGFSISTQVMNCFANFNMTTKVNYSVGELDDQSINPTTLVEGVKTIKLDLQSKEDVEKNYDLVLARNICSVNLGSHQTLKSTLQFAAKSVKDNGFIILLERSGLTPAEIFLTQFGDIIWTEIHEDEIKTIGTDLGLIIVGKKCDGLTSTLYILRKTKPPSLSQQEIMIKINNNNYDWVETIKEAVTVNNGNRVWLIADDPSSGVIGLVNCLRREPSGKNLRCVLNANPSKGFLHNIKGTDSIFAELLRKDLVMNVLRDGHWGSYRHHFINSTINQLSIPTEHVYLTILTPGDLSTLRWKQSSMKYFNQKHSTEKNTLCNVYYAPLNFKDIMLATGRISADVFTGLSFGHDFSGKELSPGGRRIMGMVAANAIATQVIPHPILTWSVPDSWTLEEASTIPTVYLTVYYGLIVRGGLKHGESILIHAGSGGVGQAAIRLALSMGCEVFTTVGTIEKREYLKKRFPQLQDRNISNSRAVSFEYDIKRETRGKGVNLVLNSLSEEKLQASVRCLADHGRFLEIGKFDLTQNNPLGMYAFLKNISFHGVLLDALFTKPEETVQVCKQLEQLISKGISDGTIQPLETTIFDINQVETAFRFMASGKHIGKVVIKVREEAPQGSSIVPKLVAAIPSTLFNPNKTYIITGGLGGIGFEMAVWLVERGCRKLVLTSRTGKLNGYQRLNLKRLRDRGITVEISTKDFSTKSEAQTLISESSKIGPIGGVFNLAMVLIDGFLENQTRENFNEVAKSKVKGTINLDEVTRCQCPDLEWFVAFSSVSCGRGNAGQSNYGFANSVMERICEQRRRDSLPGLAVQWGIIGDVGFVDETMGGKDVVIGGLQAQRIRSFFETLDFFLQLSSNNHEPQSRSTIFSSFVPAEVVTDSSDKSGKKNILQAIGHILGQKDMTSASRKVTLGELGLDSLMGVEVKQLLERDYDLNLTAQEIRQLSLKKIEELGSGSDVVRIVSPVNGQETQPNFEQREEILKSLRIPEESIVPLNFLKTPGKIFMIHDVDGDCGKLQSLGSHLNISAIGIQCVEDTPISSIQELSQNYIQKMRNIQPEGPYHISGYSFGAQVAFEMAVELQKQIGLEAVKTLTLLDAAPNFLTIQLKGHISRKQDMEIEGAINVLKTMFQRVINNRTLELIDNMPRMGSWEKQLKAGIPIIIDSLGVKVNAESLEKAAKSYYQKFVATVKYAPCEQFRGTVTLIKASEALQIASQLPEDYGLSKYVDGEINLHSVSGNHISFLENESAVKVAEIINSQFDTQK